MMIISYSKRFIFIHIYKTAGTSITSLLLPHARLIEKISGYYPTRKGVSGINRLLGLGDMGNKWVNGVHKHATAVDVKNYLGSGKFNSYYKFAFVRHPLDWQVSLYEYIRSNTHRDHGIAQKLPFKNFVIREMEKKSKRQCDFLLQGDELTVDFVGKVENIYADGKKILDSIGIGGEIPHLNKSPRGKSFHDYYDKEIEDAVRDYYAKDFQLFGYD